jgi:hypothetical protein
MCIGGEPREHAILYNQGTIIKGRDGNKWVAKFNDVENTMEWCEFTAVVLNGYRALTVDYLRQNIGKEICIYERETKYGKWPSKVESNLYKLVWTPNGDAMSMVNGIIIRNWLITQTPAIMDDTVFLLLGFGNGHSYSRNGNCEYNDGNNEWFEMALQVNNKNKKTVSSSIDRLDAFVCI